MCLNMLPSSAAEKARERRDLSMLQQYINKIDVGLGRLNDAELAKKHAQRMSSSLKPRSRSSVNAVVDGIQNYDKCVNVNDEIARKLDTLISASSPKPTSKPLKIRRQDFGWQDERQPRQIQVSPWT